MVNVLIVTSIFIVCVSFGLIIRNRLRTNPDVLEKNPELKRAAGFFFIKNKAGTFSYSPHALLVFFVTFFAFFSGPFFSAFHKEENINPDLVEYIKNTGGIDAWKKMSPAQLEEYKKKIQELVAAKH